MSLWCTWVHRGTAEASTACELLEIRAKEFGSALREKSVVHRLAVEYGQQYHRRVMAAHPPLAPWPTDLHVPFTDYCDLVVSMSEEAQKIIGLTVLEHMSSSFPNKWKLQEEVEEGKSVLVMTERGYTFRVVSLVALRVKNAAGLVLVQLGKWEGKENEPVIPSCLLPGLKQHRTELTARQ